MHPNNFAIPLPLRATPALQQHVKDGHRGRPLVLPHRALQLRPQVEDSPRLVGLDNVLQTPLAAIALVQNARVAPLAIKVGICGQPVGLWSRRGLRAPREAQLAGGLGVHKTLVPRVFGEGRVDVVVQGQTMPPTSSSERLANPAGKEAKLGVPPPETREPRSGTHRTHHRPQHRLDVLGVRGQRHGSVPSAHLLLEGPLASRTDIALTGLLVPPRKADGCILGRPRGVRDESLVLAHEGQEGPRAAHPEAPSLQAHGDEVAGQRRAGIQRQG
mmetsp:Transcript_18194/g.54948  ORF Transcript_18194/g.54948 Transcript_18194/m.54948 type:complete len:273 (-) Transcript_18194:258-1076(-)